MDVRALITVRRLLLGLLPLLAVLGAAPAALGDAAIPSKFQPATGAPAETARLPDLLRDLYARATDLRAAGDETTPDTLRGASDAVRDAIAARQLRVSALGLVQLDLQVDPGALDRAALDALGVTVEHDRPDLGRLQVRAPAWTLGELTGVAGVRFVRPPTYAIAGAGTALTEGDAALGVDQVRAELGLSGAGIRVGVISDGVDGLAAAQASGDLPQLVEMRAFGGDLDDGAEGTALLEIVHDLAPQAALSFASASTDLDMIAAVNHLAQRVDVVVDDLGFFFPDDQRSAVSLNTARALNNPEWPIRAYVTSNGNWARRHYQGAFNPGTDGRDLGLEFAGRVHRFAASAETSDTLSRGPSDFNEIYLNSGDEATVVLFWDDPWGASSNDYDIYLLNAEGGIVAGGTDGQGFNTDIPRETFTYENTGAAGFFRLVVQNFEDKANPNRQLELFSFFSTTLPGGTTALNFNTAASSMLAQSDAPDGVISVAAINQATANLSSIASYSSRGPTNNGAVKPDLTAVDGVSITGAGGFTSPFFGTSAAAPHIAGIAALALEAQPALLAGGRGDPTQERTLLRSFLMKTAVDLGQAGIDTIYGAGRADAFAALQAAQTDVIEVTTTVDSGPGSLRAAITAVNNGEAGAIIVADTVVAGSILLASPLPPIAAGDAILDGAGLTLDGANLPGSAIGLEIRGDRASVGGLRIAGFGGAGVQVSGVEDVTLTGLDLDANGVGLRINQGARNVQVGSDVVDGVTVINSRSHGLVVEGSGTSAVQIRNSRIGLEGRAAGANAGSGLVIRDGATNVVIGSTATAPSTITTAQAPTLVHTITGTATIDGVPAPEGTLIEAFLDGAPVGATELGAVQVGGAPGFALTVNGPGSTITFRVANVDVPQQVAFRAGGVSNVVLEASTAGEVRQYALPGGNVIAFNGGDGIRVEGSASTGNTFRGNVIHSNAGRAINLLAGANTDPAPPALTQVRFRGEAATITGTAPTGALVDIYVAADSETNPGVMPSSTGGGAVRFVGQTVAEDGRFTLDGVRLNGASVLSALRTDANGNTSRFAGNLFLGEPPLIESITPTRGSTLGGETVVIQGAGFATGIRVFFGATSATVVEVTPTRLAVLVPAGEAGTVDVTLVTEAGRVRLAEDVFEYARIRVVVLRPGWNNVVWQGRLTPITAAINTLAGRISRIYAWDPESQVYLRFNTQLPPNLNTLTQLRPNQVLWVFLNGTSTVIWTQPLP